MAACEDDLSATPPLRSRSKSAAPKVYKSSLLSACKPRHADPVAKSMMTEPEDLIPTSPPRSLSPVRFVESPGGVRVNFDKTTPESSPPSPRLLPPIEPFNGLPRSIFDELALTGNSLDGRLARSLDSHPTARANLSTMMGSHRNGRPSAARQLFSQPLE